MLYKSVQCAQEQQQACPNLSWGGKACTVAEGWLCNQIPAILLCKGDSHSV